jgi:hypothetical protein
MHTLLARVVRGRIILDEPTSLPDGAEVEVVVIDDDLSPAERADLHASIERALDDADAGRTVDARAFLANHRAGRAEQ